MWRQVLAAPTLKTVWPWSWFSLLAAKSADPFFLVQFSSYKYIFPPVRPVAFPLPFLLLSLDSLSFSNSPLFLVSLFNEEFVVSTT